MKLDIESAVTLSSSGFLLTEGSFAPFALTCLTLDPFILKFYMVLKKNWI